MNTLASASIFNMTSARARVKRTLWLHLVHEGENLNMHSNVFLRGKKRHHMKGMGVIISISNSPRDL